MQRFTEGHVLAHLHMTEIDSEKADAGVTHAEKTCTRPNLTKIKELETQPKPSFHLQPHHTPGRTPSTTGLLDPERDSIGENDLRHSSFRLKECEKVGAKHDNSSETSSDSASPSVQFSAEVAGSGEDSTSSSTVNDGERNDEKRTGDAPAPPVRGLLRRTLNSADYLGELCKILFCQS